MRFTQHATLLTLVIATLSSAGPSHGQSNPFNDALLTRARALTKAVPGPLPSTVNYLKFAEFKGPLNTMVQDAGEEIAIGAYAVFQVRYADGWIMVDAGIDREAEPDTTMTFFPKQYD